MKLSGEYFVQVKYNRTVGFSSEYSVVEHSSDIIDFNFDGTGWELITYIEKALGLGDLAKDVVVLCMVKGD